jgi:HEAT repeat protein
MTSARPDKSGPSRKAIVGWGVGMLVVLGLAWFAAAVVWPVWQVHNSIEDMLEEAPKLQSMGLSWSDRQELPYVEDLGGREATFAKMRMYLRMPKFVVRHRPRAAYLLHWGGERALPVLEGTLADADPEVRKSALGALMSVALETRSRKVIPLAISVLNDPSDEVRGLAAVQLAALAAALPEVTPKLRELLKTSSDERLLEGAVLVLGVMGKGARRAAPYLEGPRPGETPDQRPAAAEKAAPELEVLLKHKTARIRLVAAWCLWLVTAEGDKSLPVFEAELRDPEWKTRSLAASYLAIIGPLAKAAVPALKKATKDENAEVRETAEYALAAVTCEPPPIDEVRITPDVVPAERGDAKDEEAK